MECRVLVPARDRVPEASPVELGRELEQVRLPEVPAEYLLLELITGLFGALLPELSAQGYFVAVPSF